MSNPYDPQNPVKPHYFGGRKQILAIANERIDKARNQSQSGGILVYGHRGVGKTSLVTKILSLADPNREEKKVITFSRRLTKTTSDSELYQIITESTLQEIEFKKDFVSKLKDLTKQVQSAKIGEIEVSLGVAFEQKSPYHKWRTIIRTLKNVEFVMVAIDDADYLSVEALGELKSIVEEQNETPVLLVVSGGIDFESRLVEDYSPIARIFSGTSFNIGEFMLEETREVLEKPLEGSTSKWTNDAIRKVQELSKGYPYLVQCLANASYIEGKEITAERVVESVNAALELGKPWLNNELKDASDIDIISFVRIAELNKETLKSSELSIAGVSGPYIGRLVRQKVIEKISRGRYKIKKPPIVGLYHMLKRGIRLDKN